MLLICQHCTERLHFYSSNQKDAWPNCLNCGHHDWQKAELVSEPDDTEIRWYLQFLLSHECPELPATCIACDSLSRLLQVIRMHIFSEVNYPATALRAKGTAAAAAVDMAEFFRA